MTNITHSNHYVPQASLRRWSDDGTSIYAYRLLVSHSDVPEWEFRPIASTARHSDLYTTSSEIDKFERFITREYEQPGRDAVEKLLVRARMTPLDWQRIGKFVALQDVRTPLTFIEQTRRWEKQIPEVLEKVVRETVEKLKAAKAEGTVLQPAPRPDPLRESLRIRIERPGELGSGQAAIRTEVSSGRGFWIATIRHLLMGRAAGVLSKHRWSAIEPHGVEEWPLTDHPVLRLNYYSPEKYDFAGGWGKKGTELMMPMSPRHLLYVQVGKKNPSRVTFSREHTQLVQRLLVERAFRWVFARHPLPWVSSFRPREVNQAAFVAEQSFWRRWHPEQAAAETEFLRSEVPTGGTATTGETT